MNPPAIGFRPIARSDLAFLKEVYRMNRWGELEPSGWTEAAKREFLSSQFALQTADWDRNYPSARREIVLVDGKPAGRLYVDRREALRDLRIVDISLLPEFQGRGVGTAILRALSEEADRLGWTVSLHVERSNRAGSLYARLGFEPAGAREARLLMVRPAGRPSP